ncbi:Fe/S biogenesis protein nfuA [Serratia fonticola]|uniref:Fe/S biogenesis protein NfuA n=1 Tax=Serratia fonticola TaxID=47917 RepID=A0A4U9WRD8_SERFO|nr:Fe/S biogenesis protein nfuA [Serratia fonticola]
MIRITDAAQEHFAKLLAKPRRRHPNPRIRDQSGVRRRPNAVSLIARQTRWKRQIPNSSSKKLSAYVDELSAPYLDDAEIDFVTDQLGSQLTLKAPNAKMRKVDDNAPLMERVEYVLQSQINPQLAGHGGRVTLMEITDDALAILQFGGGCNGCSMVDVTLKEGIEKELLQKFPELKGVRDLTEHQRGETLLLLITIRRNSVLRPAYLHRGR